MTTSQNGWPVLRADQTRPFRWVTGNTAPGDVVTIFDYLCQRFNDEVEPIRKDWSWGWAPRPIRGSTTISNHASGTAIDLNAPAHPLGKRGTFTPKQMARIDGILGDLQGVVRWGGNYLNRADEMHFEINDGAHQVAAVTTRIKEEDMAFTDADRKKLDKIIDVVRSQNRKTRDIVKDNRSTLLAVMAEHGVSGVTADQIVDALADRLAD